MSIKAVGIAIKLTIEGINQAGYFQTWLFAFCNYFSYMHSYSVSLPEQGAVGMNFKI